MLLRIAACVEVREEEEFQEEKRVSGKTELSLIQLILV